ncbi:NUDIX domain-containing protein [Roseomonas xinghualingensis]|uniref:NUDIX domain-containing protein n=1 Tax=Roseomonas xinghualingensis TaxID=2986475 RepID=UPI0021F0A511|nr:NUDIX domain-containing protein [Roseomonas sp. SXEYE001]MCV4206743.1 NUDIX domain-containing protein [Roseomonas sp. SXEYE001]
MTEQDGAAPPLPAGRPAKAPPIPAHPLYVPEVDEVVWDGRFPVQRVRFRYRKRDGSLSGPVTWEVLRRGQGTVILPWDPFTDRIALIEQFRLPALAAGEEPRITELPAGLVEQGEDPTETARRELEEETGLSCTRTEPMGTFLLMQGAADERVHFQLAQVSLKEEASMTAGLPSENEETLVVVVDAAEAFAMVADNRIRNAPAALALLWLQVNHARLKAEWTQ